MYDNWQVQLAKNVPFFFCILYLSPSHLLRSSTVFSFVLNRSTTSMYLSSGTTCYDSLNNQIFLGFSRASSLLSFEFRSSCVRIAWSVTKIAKYRKKVYNEFNHCFLTSLLSKHIVIPNISADLSFWTYRMI